MSRTLIIRLSALGDVAMASGLIPALRRAEPDGFLAWLVEPPAADLLRHNPRLDALIVWPKRRWQALWRARRYRELARELRAFRTRLRSYRFDRALDAQGILKSALLARLSGAPQRIGLGSREGSRALMTRVVAPPSDDPRLGSEYRLLGAALGLRDGVGDDYRMDVAVGAAERAAVASLLRGTSPHGTPPRFAALCPFTTRPQKHWFEPRWAQLAVRLQNAGLTPLLLGGPDDAAAAARIVDAAAAAGRADAAPGLVNLAGRTTLGEAVAAIADSVLLVGVDTGLTHIGIALDRPTLAMFGSTRPYLHAGRRARVLYQPLPCSPCRRRPSCGGRFDCMRAHQPEPVADAALALLAA